MRSQPRKNGTRNHPVGTTAEYPVTAKTSFTSFAAPIRYYKDYERRHPQYKLVDIYTDEAVIIGLKT